MIHELTRAELAQLGTSTAQGLCLVLDALDARATSERADFPTEPERDVALSSALGPTSRVFLLDVAVSGEVVLGRGSAATICLTDSALSNAHLALEIDGTGRISARDLGAKNGTWLNGQRLEPQVRVGLGVGDTLVLADCYRLQLLRASSSSAVTQSKNQLFTEASRPDPSPPVGTGGGLLRGKTAVITGAGRGIGRACALLFAAEGCRVVVNDRGCTPQGFGEDPSVAEEVVAAIERAGGVAVASAHDVSDPAQVADLFALAASRFGALDILVCAAGVLHVGRSLLAVRPGDWQRTLATNVTGLLYCLQAAAGTMVESKTSGRIVVMGSLAAIHGNAGLLSYSASKAAVHAMAKTAAAELVPHGITVNTLTPIAWTRLTQDIPSLAAIPDAAAVLDPAYVADVALFLASDLAGGITGQVIDVSGAQLALHRNEQTPAVLAPNGRWTPQALHRHWQSSLATVTP